jgi:hypothetical protein
MPLLTVIIGNRGGGKTLFATWIVQYTRQKYKKIPIYANCKIDGAIFIEDILKFLALKIIMKDFNPIVCIIDEAALAGFEARGTGSKSSGVRSYLIALSRKTKAEVFLISQMMSMIDKRAQWLADFYILASSHYEEYDPVNPAYFEYQVYNSQLKPVSTMYLDARKARPTLYRKYNTDEIPFFDRVVEMLTDEFDITGADKAEYWETVKKAREFYNQLKQVPITN